MTRRPLNILALFLLALVALAYAMPMLMRGMYFGAMLFLFFEVAAILTLLGLAIFLILFFARALRRIR